MSLWADYLRECGIMQIIEHDWGFITFEIKGNEVWVGDCYIKPDFRGAEKGDQLIREMLESALEKGCKFICSYVNIKGKTASEALVGQLKRGWVITGLDGDDIFLKKVIEV